MTFISYAQNLEDVILWRALKQVTNGFYIDVGANDPAHDSVTKGFYEQGWRGINIEPMDEYYRKLCEDRIRDINLPILVGATNSEAAYFEIPSSGLSTMDRKIAEAHEKNGWQVVEKTRSLRTLADICNVHKVGEVHFLKIDVEGAEKQVLLGMDFSRYRPWVVLVEATAPQSQNVNYQSWEYILADNKYQYVYFDGLNRYYLAEEKVQLLKQFFVLPPNVFDEYQRVLEYSLGQRNQILTQELERIEKENKELRQEQTRIQKENQLLAHELESNLHSKSWRITAPFRFLGTYVRALKKVALLPRAKGKKNLKNGLKSLVISLLRIVVGHPLVKRFVVPWVKKYPKIAMRLRRTVLHVKRLNQKKMVESTPRARQLCQQLKVAIKHRKRESL